MIGIKIANIGLVFLTVVVFFSGCATDMNEYKFERERQKVENNTLPFDPAYFKEAERKHLAIFFDIVDGELILSTRPAQIRPGRMPYRSETTGNVIVVYKGADGKEIGRYAIDDPVLARSCDFDFDKAGETKLIKHGTAEILLPYNPNITTVGIGRVDQKLKLFNVSPQIKEGFKAQEKERQ